MESYYEAECVAIRNNPSILNSFLRLHLNVWVGSDIAWMSSVDFAKGDIHPQDITGERFKGRRCYGGLDLSSKRDLSSFSLLFPPEKKDEVFEWLVFFWCPEDTIEERDKKENVHYSQWVREGKIFTCQGDMIVQADIRAFIEKCHMDFIIEGIGFDRYRASETVIYLQDQGITLNPVAQTKTAMNEPIETMEGWILQKKLNHAGNPVLRWQSNNAMLSMDSNENKMFDKKRSRDKIDGMVSGSIAVHQYLTSLSEPKTAEMPEDYRITFI